MALDLQEILLGEAAIGLRSGAQHTAVADRNLVQGLGVIQNTIIQSVGATADDAQLMSAMRTATQVPSMPPTANTSTGN